MNEPALVLDVLKVFGLAGFSFFVAFFLTPILTHYLYKYKLWPRRIERESLGGGPATVIAGLEKKGTIIDPPRMGGILFWGTVLIFTALFGLMGKFFEARFL